MNSPRPAGIFVCDGSTTLPINYPGLSQTPAVLVEVALHCHDDDHHVFHLLNFDCPLGLREANDVDSLGGNLKDHHCSCLLKERKIGVIYINLLLQISQKSFSSVEREKVFLYSFK